MATVRREDWERSVPVCDAKRPSSSQGGMEVSNGGALRSLESKIFHTLSELYCGIRRQIARIEGRTEFELQNSFTELERLREQPDSVSSAFCPVSVMDVNISRCRKVVQVAAVDEICCYVPFFGLESCL